MADNKCDYCKNVNDELFCIAESKMKEFDESAWAEDYSKCDSNFYLACPCYLHETKIKIKNKSILEEKLDNLKWGDEFS